MEISASALLKSHENVFEQNAGAISEGTLEATPHKPLEEILKINYEGSQ